MLTTAGAARATASAKPGRAGRAAPGDAAAAGKPPDEVAGIGGAPADAPAREAASASSAGFHKTRRKAVARPMTMALSKKLMRKRAFCN
jgi:hypothetical protein